MLVPDDRRYSEDHQWLRVEGEICRVGITEFAQEALGEITMVQLAEPEALVAAGHEMGEIEAFKAMTDLYMPIEASVVEHNPALTASPDAVNRDPYGEGWLCTVRPADPTAIADLLDAAAYRTLIGYTDG